MGLFDSPSESSKMWDPYVELGFCNPDRAAFTCVGYAPSQGRRCRNPIAAHNRVAVKEMLATMASKSPKSSMVTDLLPKIAPLSLCLHYHQDQAQEVVHDWKAKIRSMKSFKSEDSWSSNTDRETIKLKQKNKVLEGQNVKLERETRKLRQERDELKKEKSQLEREKLLMEINKMVTQLELDRVKRELENLKEKEQEQERSDESQQGEREAQKKEKQERERRRKEQEKREHDEKNERIRQAAQRKREERERQEREKAEKEKKEWEEAWKNYTKSWTVFKENCSKPNPDPEVAVPWPVKTGCYADVTASNVQDFYDNACPDQDSPEKLYRIMTDEARKWHPDKILVLLEGCGSIEGAKKLVEMICMAVLKVREKAREGRGE